MKTQKKFSGSEHSLKLLLFFIPAETFLFIRSLESQENLTGLKEGLSSNLVLCYDAAAAAAWNCADGWFFADVLGRLLSTCE